MHVLRLCASRAQRIAHSGSLDMCAILEQNGSGDHHDTRCLGQMEDSLRDMRS